MVTPQKIEEWIKEVEDRPASAGVILQYVSNRLRDLTERNEELRAENLALRTEKKVEEYERRIATLEYQLEMLRRQLGGDAAALEGPLELAGMPAEGKADAGAALPLEKAFLILYDAHGRMRRVEYAPAALTEGALLATLAGMPLAADHLPRMQAVATQEELLFVFSSGRVSTRPALGITPVNVPDWARSPIPDEPRGGESLCCLAPVSRLALADFFVQASLRGWAKRVGTSLAGSILEKHYIGTGAAAQGDRTLGLSLAKKDDLLVMVSRDGYLASLEIKALPFAVEEAFRLSTLDYLAAAFTSERGRPLLVMTNTGKLLQLAPERWEGAGGWKSKGVALYTSQRREQGVRVVGAAALQSGDWTIALHRDGRVTAHSAQALMDSGALGGGDEIVGFAPLVQPARKGG